MQYRADLLRVRNLLEKANHRARSCDSDPVITESLHLAACLLSQYLAPPSSEQYEDGSFGQFNPLAGFQDVSSE